MKQSIIVTISILVGMLLSMPLYSDNRKTKKDTVRLESVLGDNYFDYYYIDSLTLRKELNRQGIDDYKKLSLDTKTIFLHKSDNLEVNYIVNGRKRQKVIGSQRPYRLDGSMDPMEFHADRILGRSVKSGEQDNLMFNKIRAALVGNRIYSELKIDVKFVIQDKDTHEFQGESSVVMLNDDMKKESVLKIFVENKDTCTVYFDYNIESDVNLKGKDMLIESMKVAPGESVECSIDITDLTQSPGRSNITVISCTHRFSIADMLKCDGGKHSDDYCQSSVYYSTNSRVSKNEIWLLRH